MSANLSSANDHNAPDKFRGAFRTDRLARDLYADGAGIARAIPAAVAVPRDADDISALVRWARPNGYALIPRGSGSGMAAGAVGSGVVVDLSRLTTIGSVDVTAQRIRAGCGALRGDVDAAARREGLRFPVDPSSGAFCTIGGMAATNAAGARTLRFGAMREWVTAVHCVFDDGSQAWIRGDEPPPIQIPAVARMLRTLEATRVNARRESLVHAHVRKESSGYAVARALESNGHLLDLLIGSEGTLAFFVEVELRLIPVAATTATVLATFPSLEAATDAAAAARDLGASACELLDRTFLDLAATERSTGVPAATEAVLIAEVESDSDAQSVIDSDQLAAAFRSCGALEIHTALDAASEHALWELRHAASPILSRLAPRICSMQFIEDGCVPPDRLADYVRGVRASLARAECAGVIFGHAGDAHVHVNPLIDVTRLGWRDRMRRLLDSVCELTETLGGTLSGEHGDGRLRAPLMGRVWSVEARAAFENIKAAGDPSAILNPGCKIAIAGDDPIESVRYDPDAPALDPRAAEILSRIERERAWSTFRLGQINDVSE